MASLVLLVTGLGAAPASAEVRTSPPPRLLEVRITSPAVLGPGQSLTIEFTLSRPADYVDVTVANQESQQTVAVRSGPTSGSLPSSGSVSLPVDAEHLTWSGPYAVTAISAGFDGEYLQTLDGTDYYYYRIADYAADGGCRYNEGGYCLPGDPYGDLAFSVDAPAFRLSDNQNLTPPSIVGTPSFGENISVDDGTWAAGTAHHRFLRDGVDVDDHPSWVVEEDIGHDVSVVATSYAEGYRPLSVTSAPVTITSPISASPAGMTGRAVVGETVMASFDEASVVVDPPQPVTVTYKLNSEPITRDQLVHRLEARNAGRPFTVEAMVTTTGTPAVQRPFSARTAGSVRYQVAGEGIDAGFSPDLVARDAAGRLLLYPTDGVGHWLPMQTIGVEWNVFNLVLNVGDFDGDGNGDVVGRDAAGGLFLYPGDGQGGWLPQRQIGWGWNDCPGIVPVGDFDGDGRNDLLCRTEGGQLVFYPGQGDGTFRPPQPYMVNRLGTAAFPGWSNPLIGEGWNSLSAVFSPGDVDGDGHNDVLGRDAAGQLLLFRGDGNGGWLSDRATVVGWGWGGMARIGGAGDFDGDGAPDVWAIDGSGQFIVYYGDGQDGWWGSSVVGWGWDGFTAVT